MTSLHFFLCSALRVCACVHLYMLGRGWCLESPSGSLFYEAQGTIDVWLEWQPQSSRGLLVCIQHLAFYLGADPSSGVHVCTVGTLPSESSPQPRVFNLDDIMLYVVWDY